MSFTADFDAIRSVSALREASRFDTYFDVYGLGLRQEAGLEQRTITLIARSPASPPARALAMNLARFRPLSIEIRIIFAHIAPAGAMNALAGALAISCERAPETIMRWAKNRALLDAHERLTLGRSLCWTGDSMRRAEDTRSAIDRVDDATPAVLAEAYASFHAMWAASKPLPATLFSKVAFRGDAARIEEMPAPAVWPDDSKVVHFSKYARVRRH